MSQDNGQASMDNNEVSGNAENSADGSTRSTSPPPSSASSWLEACIGQNGSPERSPSEHGIVEVSDKDDEEEEVEDEAIQYNLRCSSLGLGSLRSHRLPPTLMACGHPAPSTNKNQIKQWVSNGRSWCQSCNPQTSQNLIRSSEERSGWRMSMLQYVEKNVFPPHVLNMNETYIYSGDNGGKIVVPKLQNQVFLMDLDLFIPIVCAEDLCQVPLRALTCFRSFVSNDTRVVDFFQRLHPQSLCHFSVGLIEAAIRVMEDPTETGDVAFRRSRVALQTFYHTAARVLFFRETIGRHQLAQWLSLLRVEFLRHDMILCIFVAIKDLHKWFFNADDLYIRLLTDLIIIWSNPALMAENRHAVQQIFVSLLETEPTFLQDCYKALERETFSELLAITDNLVQAVNMCRSREFETEIMDINGSFREPNLAHRKCFLHRYNLQFMVDLFEILDREITEGRSYNRYEYGVRLPMIIDIIYFCSLFRNNYDPVLVQSQKAIKILCGILKAVNFALKDRPVASIVSGTPHNPSRIPSYVNRIPRSDVPISPDQDEDQENGAHKVPKQKQTKDSDKFSVERYMKDSIRHLLNKHKADENGGKTEKEEKKEEPEEPMEEDENADKTLQEAKENTAQYPPKAPSIKSLDSGDEPLPKHARLDPKHLALVKGALAERTRELADEAIDEEEEEEAEEEELLEDEDDEDDEDEGDRIPKHIEGIFGNRSDFFFSQYLAQRAPEESPKAEEEQAYLPYLRLFQLIANRTLPQHLFMSLKQATIRCIGGLCRHSLRNQLAAGKLDIINLVIQCTMKQDVDRAAVLHHGLTTLRALCVDCHENQQRLLEIFEVRRYNNFFRKFGFLNLKIMEKSFFYVC
uniref:Non-specific protein-tyrosine kinase n=1 Tax=Bursaphelenchus xylophilus TaxID=6326 RepID=A0A1I7S1Y3_BURXY